MAKQTWPDVIFDASSMASNIKNATVQTVHEPNRIVCKLKSKKVTLNFQHLGKDRALKIIVFSDASFGNLSNGGTQGGHLILQMGAKTGGSYHLCAWQLEIRGLYRAHLLVKHWQCLMELTVQFFWPHCSQN